MHCAFNLLVFPNSMFTLSLLFYLKGYVLSGEIALKNYHYYYYYSIHVLTKDSAVTGAQLCQYSSCLPWLCLFGCGNGWRSAIKQF